MVRKISSRTPQGKEHLLKSSSYHESLVATAVRGHIWKNSNRETVSSRGSRKQTPIAVTARVKDLPEIPGNTDVWITTDGQPMIEQVVSSANAPRSYIVHTPTGEVRRQLNV